MNSINSGYLLQVDDMSMNDEVEQGKLIKLHGELLRTTEAAALFHLDELEEDTRFPKSQLHQSTDGTWYVREWMAKQKGLV